MNKCVKTAELYDCQVSYLKDLFAACEYPWEMLPKIKEWIAQQTQHGLPDFTEVKSGVWVGKNVKIADNVTVEAPAIIGHGTEIRTGAYLRGNVITGENCVLGNSSELKNCILLDKVQVPHYNYVGDSILGNKAHMGAGSICSNLKSDGKAVIIHGDVEYSTELRKIGGILADGADIGCGCVINPGTVIGPHSNVYPLSSVRGYVPPNSIYKARDAVIEKR